MHMMQDRLIDILRITRKQHQQRAGSKLGVIEISVLSTLGIGIVEMVKAWNKSNPKTK